jgi:hypothetical protein
VEPEGSQSLKAIKYGHECRGTRNQKSLCWRGPAAISQSVIRASYSSAVKKDSAGSSEALQSIYQTTRHAQ